MEAKKNYPNKVDGSQRAFEFALCKPESKYEYEYGEYVHGGAQFAIGRRDRSFSA